MRNALLLIDCQYDFCDPEGALFVPGAVEDMERLARLIEESTDQIEAIYLSQDAHSVNDISHPTFWEDQEGNSPKAFTQITYDEILEGHWKPRFAAEKAKAYVKKLEEQESFPHFIWPEHCLLGTKGCALDEVVMEAVLGWSRKQGKAYQVVPKGQYPYNEHFGIFAAQVHEEDMPATHFNHQLAQELEAFDRVLLAGEAKSHCVATSLMQILDERPVLASKLTLISDCMSNVPEMGHLGDPIYQRAERAGVLSADAGELDW